jgi:hypothetical protein
MADGDRLREVVRLLREELRARADRHPAGHLLGRRGDALLVEASVPLAADEDLLDEAAGSLGERLQQALSGLLAQRSVLQAGCVYCLRCRTSGCAHSRPGGSREVFAGYGPSGVPRFVDFGQWLLSSGDIRVETLYREGRSLVAHWSGERELTRDLLPAFRDARVGFRLLGQVAAGWYRVPAGERHSDALALSFQIVSTSPEGRKRRFGLNVVGAAPGGAPLEDLHERLGALPWSAAVRWTQLALEDVERHQRGRRRQSDEVIERRMEGLLAGLARRLEQRQRSSSRRTRHAERRHESGQRPTRMAVLDLERARAEDILVDGRDRTLVVLGERGRTHFFNRSGKLVTSVRYPPETIERRKSGGRWRPASSEDVAALRQAVSES